MAAVFKVLSLLGSSKWCQIAFAVMLISQSYIRDVTCTSSSERKVDISSIQNFFGECKIHTVADLELLQEYLRAKRFVREKLNVTFQFQFNEIVGLLKKLSRENAAEDLNVVPDEILACDSVKEQDGSNVPSSASVSNNKASKGISSIDFRFEKISFQDDFYMKSPNSNERWESKKIPIRKLAMNFKKKEIPDDEKIKSFFNDLEEKLSFTGQSKVIIISALKDLHELFPTEFTTCIKDFMKILPCQIEVILQVFFSAHCITESLMNSIVKEIPDLQEIHLKNVFYPAICKASFLSNLTELYLNGIDFISSAKAVFEIIAHLPNLRTVSLGNTFLSMQFLAFLKSKQIFNIANWKYLHINLEYNNIDAESIKNFSKMKELEEITIRCPKNYKVIFAEWRTFEESENISKVTLCDFPDEELGIKLFDFNVVFERDITTRQFNIKSVFENRIQCLQKETNYYAYTCAYAGDTIDFYERNRGTLKKVKKIFEKYINRATESPSAKSDKNTDSKNSFSKRLSDFFCLP